MPKLNQKGVVHFLLPLILFTGIIGGVWLVTQGDSLKLFSKASNLSIVFRDLWGNPLPQNKGEKGSIPQTALAKVQVILTSPFDNDIYQPNSNQNGSEQNLKKGLLSYWPLDEGGGGVQDAVSGHTAKASNTVSLDGPSGKAKFFNGESSFIGTSFSETDKFQNQVSLSAWVNPAQLKNWATVIMSSDSDNWSSGFGLAHLNQDNKVIDFFVNGYKNHVGVKVPLGEWSHLVGVYDGQTVKIYLNGKLVENLRYYESSEISHSLLTLSIGKGKSSEAEKLLWNGGIDEVGVWNRALTDEEVTELYDMKGIFNYPPLTSPKPSPISQIEFRYAEMPADLESSIYKPFTVNPMEINYTFNDCSPGKKFLWVEFKKGSSSQQKGTSPRNSSLEIVKDIKNCLMGYWTVAHPVDLLKNHQTTVSEGGFTESKDFNGKDYLLISSTSKEFTLAKELSISAWINPFELKSWSSILLRSTTSNWSNGYGLAHYNQDDQTIHFFINDYKNHVGVKIPLRNWSHLVGTYDGKIIKLYLNGKLVESTKYEGKLDTQISEFTAGQGIVGLVDELAIWRRALTDDEITLLYNHGNPVNLIDYSSPQRN